jgi:hypothetical protein
MVGFEPPLCLGCKSSGKFGLISGTYTGGVFLAITLAIDMGRSLLF